MGLVLFAHLIGNRLTYLQSLTVRLEEWRLKRRDTEEWTRHQQLPKDLKQLIRCFVQYRWLATRGVDEKAILRGLPSDLRRDIQRHLCLDLVRRVPLFSQMDDQLLEAICDRDEWANPFWKLVHDGLNTPGKKQVLAANGMQMCRLHCLVQLLVGYTRKVQFSLGQLAVFNVPAEVTTRDGRRHREDESQVVGQPEADSGGSWKPDVSVSPREVSVTVPRVWVIYALDFLFQRPLGPIPSSMLGLEA
ncbi:hypothetical protein Nepgr_022519 [Nepenthes gracilis]|uniref:Uncharacterized protein n=1 Tax=Nepenthes gracilis TaxID=150966 RepID=A0AAD3T0G5_NEPGR|nr:hypothetical protein Nepgr_022519 [Nepenthes gracilis]